MVEFRVAKLQDMVDLAPRLRKADVDEVYASAGHDPFTSLVLSFGEARRAWVAVIDGKVECAFGISEATPDVGIPWMLGSEVITKHSKRLVRDARSVVDDMNTAYPTLCNSVDVRNTVAIRWLKHLGFEFLPAIEHGPNKYLFYPFYRHNNV